MINARKEVDVKMETHSKECVILKEKNTKLFEDFINTCISEGGNSIDYCLNSDAGKIVSNFSITTCVADKTKLLY